MPESNSVSQIRAFVAVALDAAVLEKIRRAQDALAHDRSGAGVRWTGLDQLHLTLKFLGNIQAGDVGALQAALQTAAEGIGPFRLVARGLGCFPSCRRPSVIWVGLDGELSPLQELQGRVERATRPFASHSEDRAFHPHVTIGRVKFPGPAARAISERVEAQGAVDFGQWEVDRIALIRSELTRGGSIYTTLCEVRLEKS